MAEPLVINAQATPNPNAVKFTLNRVVAAQGKTYRDQGGAEAPWAGALLAIPGVTQVFAVNNFISVSKRAEAEWGRITPEVERVLQQAFA